MLVGPANVGKSQLLAAVTGSSSELFIWKLSIYVG